MASGGRAVMRRRTLLSAGLTAVWPRILIAQSPDQAKQNADQSVRVGDRWFYRARDELTQHAQDVVLTVTAVTDKEYDTIQKTVGPPRQPVALVFDHDWNVIENPSQSFNPHDGSGVRLPLTVGDEWQCDYQQRNKKTGATVPGSARCKVTGQEQITTIAGAFATFRIVHQITAFDNGTETPFQKLEGEMITWYAPEVHRYVQRSLSFRADDQIRSSWSWHLVDFQPA
jgi:hypothetical protein